MKPAVQTLILMILVTLAGCAKMSERIRDDSAGLNGGFEHVRAGLPVNWQVYTPSTIPTGDYELIVDREDFKQGRQSLKFLVRECSADGGWHSPGIAQEVPAEPGAAYRVSFWVKNVGTDYQVRVGGVAPKTGEMVAIAPESPADVWTRVEHTYVMPDDYASLRFELSIRSPGSLWLDGVEIEPVSG